VQESSVASILAMYYTLHTARQKDRVGLMRVLGTLANCKNDRAFEDPFLHSLVSTDVLSIFSQKCFITSDIGWFASNGVFVFHHCW
jgi:hypothetical protein